MQRILCTLVLVTMVVTSTLPSSSPNYIQEAQHFANQYAHQLSGEQLQLLANFCFFAHEFCRVDMRVRKLNHLVRNSTLVLHQELLQSKVNDTTLYKLMVSITALIKLAPIHKKLLTAWHHAREYLNAQQDPVFNAAINDLQHTISLATEQYAADNTATLNDYLVQAQKTSLETMYALDLAAKSFTSLQTIIVQPAEHVDATFRTSEYAYNHTFKALQDIAPIIDHAEHLQIVPLQMFKTYYEYLFDQLAMLEDPTYSTVLFDEQGIIPEEKRTLLPYPQNMLKEFSS